jgi:hypothetical protein
VKNRRHIENINDEFIATVARQLGANESLRYQLADEGELHIDRQLPFLCLYRRPTTTGDSGTDALITGQAAYLKITTVPAYQDEISKLLQAIISTQSRLFGGFLIVEVFQPIEKYISCLRGADCEEIPVIEILNMAS